MDSETGWQVVRSQRLSLADMLDTLTEDEWERPSLCAEWRVRDVVAHLVIGANAPKLSSMFAAGVRAGFNPHHVGRDTAIRLAESAPDELVDRLRDHAGGRRLPVPVFTDYRDMVCDILVHGQDIAIPTGRDRPMPTDAACLAATRVWTMGWPFWAKRKLRGLRLSATDADWSVGEGELVEGPISALLLLVAGRRAALDRLDGATNLIAR
ncbi:maleylpyruvate isomerase family mycothiol-dependent enzyme [Antrihabitans sp. YC2-6]|uniref:maleylpyruvate isomerase family mycothiol-dependent enzyme n=1 Tax=Antrihabitans sp. YC2-6 TaxID=2799498 RepID=UPI0018F2B9B9|nr:maleylpyruvate isomerase family mycothiol-dependent enzyme [Antrihabitans sp. YC2-6]MBJ8347545.1 maleylpyruvate isomerase family mycothiol-dependent enzyme [Antrihabitans sp. YC2-6]